MKEWLDCGNPAATIYTNRRVLELKSDKEKLVADDVVCEDSVIIPPVYIARGVSLNSCVVGPYVSVGEGCSISDSRISNSIIGKATVISKSVIGESMIGSNAMLKGRAERLSVGDYNVTDWE